MLLTIILGCFLLMWWKLRSSRKNKQSVPSYTPLPGPDAYARTSANDDLSSFATGVAAATIIDSIADSLSSSSNDSIFDSDDSGFDGFGGGDSIGGGSDGDF